MGGCQSSEQADCWRNNDSSKLISDSPDALPSPAFSLQDSVAFAVDHPDEAATLVGKYGIVQTYCQSSLC